MNQSSLFGKSSRACFFDLRQGRGRTGEFSAYAPKAVIYFSTTHQIPVVTDPAQLRDYDVVFFSLHSFRDFYRVAELSPRKRKGQEWIAGGNAVTTPTGVLWIMDYVFVGDAKAVFADILRGARDIPGMIRSGVTTSVEYQDAPLTPEPLAPNEIVMSKGCPRRCLFCIHPWRTTYEEQDKGTVLDFIKTRRGKGLGLNSNSSDDVSYYGEVNTLLTSLHKTDMVVSNAIQGLTEDVIRDRKRELLLGIEGMSGYLRWVVNKPIHRALYHEKLDQLLTYGKQIRTVYQFNLPGETDADWQEFLDDLNHFRGKYKTGSWAIPFIPHQNTAHTPLQFETPRYHMERALQIQELRASLFGSGKTGISIYMPAPLYPANWFSQLIAEWIPITPAVVAAVKKLPQRATVEQMVSFLSSKDVALPPAFLHRTPETVFPWDMVRIHSSRADLLKRHAAMRNRMNRRADYNQTHGNSTPAPIAYEV